MLAGAQVALIVPRAVNYRNARKMLEAEVVERFPRTTQVAMVDDVDVLVPGAAVAEGAGYSKCVCAAGFWPRLIWLATLTGRRCACSCATASLVGP